VSLGVVASAGAVAAGLQVADPLIGLGITAVILRITWQSWGTVRERGRDR
jgi:divalent metal cation (Fe/Co/Zn/Cd) transporter